MQFIIMESTHKELTKVSRFYGGFIPPPFYPPYVLRRSKSYLGMVLNGFFNILF